MAGFKDEFLKRVKSLSEEEKKIFDRIYRVQETRGELNPPVEMTSWLESQFGSVDDVKRQDFIKITNMVTYEGAIFNELRTSRPVVGDENFSEVIAQIETANGGPFSKPETGTPEDVFGRIKGRYCITAANVAKYDGLHGLIIFDDHNPLLISRKRVRDYLDVAAKWFEKAYAQNKEARYPLFTWNCLWKAGASIIHGHAQVVLTEGHAYAKIEELRSLTHKYQEACQSNYYEDVFMLHSKLGLGFEKNGVRIMSKITPVKEKEVAIISASPDANLATVVSDVLNTFIEKLGVASFNLAIVLPPMTETPEAWGHMPVLVRIVDRGKLTTKTADIGAMELYAQSVIGSNPYVVIEELRGALR